MCDKGIEAAGRTQIHILNTNQLYSSEQHAHMAAMTIYRQYNSVCIYLVSTLTYTRTHTHNNNSHVCSVHARCLFTWNREMCGGCGCGVSVLFSCVSQPNNDFCARRRRRHLITRAPARRRPRRDMRSCCIAKL